MNSNRLFIKGLAISFAVAATAASMSGQVLKVDAGKTLTERPMAVAERNNLYCAGYVQTAPVNTDMQIVGSHEEQEQYAFSQNNVVYINAGANSNLKEGDVLSVFRPRGKVSNNITEKKGSLGFFVQEIGAVEVFRVNGDYSLAKVKASCDNFMLGDLLEPISSRTSPMFQSGRPPLDRYGSASDKPSGRIFLTRGNQELITRDQIVYIDLGAEDNVKVGDYVTVYRALGKGNFLMPADSETGAASSYGYSSDHYKGTKFSNQAPRRDGDKAQKGTYSQKDAKSERPNFIRKVVGELVVLNVKERTATAVVTRTGQEIHPGDFVEIQ